jgi:hypothetical protein
MVLTLFIYADGHSGGAAIDNGSRYQSWWLVIAGLIPLALPLLFFGGVLSEYLENA